MHKIIHNIYELFYLYKDSNPYIILLIIVLTLFFFVSLRKVIQPNQIYDYAISTILISNINNNLYYYNNYYFSYLRCKIVKYENDIVECSYDKDNLNNYYDTSSNNRQDLSTQQKIQFDIAILFFCFVCLIYFIALYSFKIFNLDLDESIKINFPCNILSNISYKVDATDILEHSIENDINCFNNISQEDISQEKFIPIDSPLQDLEYQNIKSFLDKVTLEQICCKKQAGEVTI